MDELCVGRISKLTDGKFDNQYNVEITLPDGTKYEGADGLSVYEKKQDGSEAKVWPLVKHSRDTGSFYKWSGNFKRSDTKAGPRLYATITWGELADDVVPETPASGDWSVPQESGAGTSTRNEEQPAAATPAPASLSKNDYWDRKEQRDLDLQQRIEARQSLLDARDADRTLQMEAAWALHAALEILPKNSKPDAVLDKAKELAQMKRVLAEELKDSPGGTPASPTDTKLAESSPGRDVEGGSGQSPSPGAGNGETSRGTGEVAATAGSGSPDALSVLQQAVADHRKSPGEITVLLMTQAIQLKKEPEDSGAYHNDWSQLDEEVLRNVADKLMAGAEL